MSIMNTTPESTPSTASTQYDQHQTAILNLLDELAGDIAMHNVRFDRAGRRDYGYPGDLAHIEELLRQAHDFLNPTAADGKTPRYWCTSLNGYVTIPTDEN